jgi:hypothetical protein
MRKAHREGAETIARPPSAFANQLIECGMKNGCVDSFPERLLPISREPDDRSGPACGIVRIARQIPPHDGAAFIGKFSRKGTVDPDKAVLNELLELRAAERTRRFMGRHEILISLGRQGLAAARGVSAISV